MNTKLRISVYFVIWHAILLYTSAKPSVEEKGKIFEGDISMSKNERKEMKMEMKYNGAVDHPNGWKNGLIPYEIDRKFTPLEIASIKDAMNELSESTCIRFKPRQNEADHILFIVGDKCSSKVGKTGGRQLIKMKSICMRHGTIVHELMHTLGFWHEQSRLDRDKYITIKWNNINPNSKPNFEKYSDPYTDDFGLPYDYSSIMHYSGEAFQKERGLKTIITKTKDAPIGIRTAMSHFDKLKINMMYGCKDYLPIQQ